MAAIGRAAALLRTGRRGPAADACRQVIRTLRGGGHVAEVWTTVRLAAELLADLDDPEPAATLLAAADADPLAPTILADERARQRRVRDRIARRLPTDRLAAATRRGTTLGRSAAADLALARLDAHRPSSRPATRQQPGSNPPSPRWTHDHHNHDHPHNRDRARRDGARGHGRREPRQGLRRAAAHRLRRRRSTAMTVLGDRLGLYTAMTDAGPLTAAGLAAATGLHERLVAEWLASQTVSGYVRHDPQAGTFECRPSTPSRCPWSTRPPTQSAPRRSSPPSTSPSRSSSGCSGPRPIYDYDELPPSLFEGVERFFRTAYTHELATTWFPAVDGLVPRLEAGARVADVGCGHGLSTLQIASRWPAGTVTGFDLHRPSVVMARAKAVEARVGNVAFHVADAADIGPGPFDVVVFSDSLHDMGDPPAALARAREVLVDGGTVVVIEPWSVDGLTDGIGNPSIRIDYAISTSVCTPTALAQHGGHAIGTQGGPTLRLKLLADAGFRDPVLATDTGANLVLAATR